MLCLHHNSSEKYSTIGTDWLVYWIWIQNKFWLYISSDKAINSSAIGELNISSSDNASMMKILVISDFNYKDFPLIGSQEIIHLNKKVT